MFLLTDNTENNEMPVPYTERQQSVLAYRQHREQPRGKFLTGQDREQQKAVCLQTTQRTTRCQFLTERQHPCFCLQTTRRTTRCWSSTGQDREQQGASCLQTTQRITRSQFVTERQQSFSAYKQHREQQDASSLQDRTENNKMLIAYRQHRVHCDASSLQTGQRTTKC